MNKKTTIRPHSEQRRRIGLGAVALAMMLHTRGAAADDTAAAFIEVE